MPSTTSLLALFALSAAFPILFLHWLEEIDKIEVPTSISEKLTFDVKYGESRLIRVFKIDIENELLSDLQSRLSLHRLPPSASPMFQNLTKVMVDFDWTQHQHFLNTFKQYKANIEGLVIHFLRVSIAPPKNSQVVPLLLLHGFPGCYWDFFKMIPFLSNPARFAFDFGVKKQLLFDVIVPSLPGFIFSDKPESEEFSHLDTARILMKLMHQLTDERYFIHGTEKLGVDVATSMASVDSKVWGVHLSNPVVDILFNYKVTLKSLFPLERGNLHEYFTQPPCNSQNEMEFISTAVTDSPLALCSFITQKWASYSSSSKPLNGQFTLDELATICHLYWLTDSLPSALKIHENSVSTTTKGLQVRVPTGILQSPDAPWSSSEWMLKHQYTNITRITRLDKGGVFSNLQNGEEVAADIFRFVETIVA